MSGPQASWLPDGRRLHLNHGPIDLVIEAFGEAEEMRHAYGQAVARFQTVLAELVEELTELRKPAAPTGQRAFFGTTARRMEAAVASLAQIFITPMAAVAGAVADEVMMAMVEGRKLDKAYVNNGGDIALHITSGHALTLAIGGTGHGLADRVMIECLGLEPVCVSHTPTPNPSPQGGGGFGHADAKSPSPLWGGVRGGGIDGASAPIRGIATSGWRGRSFSLGIADAVTVLAQTAAQADAAATIIANAVDLPGHPAIARQPACVLAPDSDLGHRLVTTAVGELNALETDSALEEGCRAAQDLFDKRLIAGTALFLAGETRIVGDAFSQNAVGRANTYGGQPVRPHIHKPYGTTHA
ncbi:MAG: UPF0280 family protein [Rhizobiaceae bacterium]